MWLGLRAEFGPVRGHGPHDTCTVKRAFMVFPYCASNVPYATMLIPL